MFLDFVYFFLFYVGSGFAFWEANLSSLRGGEVNGMNDPYDLYNYYAFVIGFGVRKGMTRFKHFGNKLACVEFLCHWSSLKMGKGVVGKVYTKLTMDVY